MPLTIDHIYQSLKTVIDPELGINIVDLGLIYSVKFDHSTAKASKMGDNPSISILMTLTTPGCPLGPWFVDTVRHTVATAAGLDPELVSVQITFDPPWTQDLMNAEALAELSLD